MMKVVLPYALVIGAYLLGSVPFGVVVTRLFTGRDVREVGSGNIGASNVTRAAGKAAGLITLALDAAKAVVPMLVTGLVCAGPAAPPWVAAAGLAAFFGHCYPVWLGFKGGKGVATALGVFLVLSPLAALLGVVAFGVAFALTRVPAVGSLAGTAVCAVGTFVVKGAHVASWAVLLVAAVIVFRHRENITRLAKGSEHKV